METSSLSSLVSPPIQFSGRSHHRNVNLCYRKTPWTTKVLAMRQDGNSENSEFSGRVVDENMLILRKRINEMKAIDRSDETPDKWSEWEKQCYLLYQSEICEVLGLLNLNFTKTRPNLAIGMAMTVRLSVPTSVLVVMLHLMDAASIILNAIQVK